MQLEQLNLALRRRSGWEALDLGLVMLRRWYAPVYRAWAATFLLFALPLMLLLWQWPLLAMLIVWWLKPLFDRVLLKVFAEAAFGAAPTVAAVWRALPQLLRHSGLLAALSFRRFNVTRAFDLPVWQLEGQSGKAGRARLRILGRRTSGYAIWLIFVCAHVVGIFECSLIVLLDFLTPVDGPPSFSWWEFFSAEDEEWHRFAVICAWLAAESVVEPFYVAAGFSLYLNRRSELEGWDIEVAFRRLATRQTQAGAMSPVVSRTAMLLIAGSLAAASLAGSPAARAEETAAAATTVAASPAAPAPIAAQRPAGTVRQQLDKVLADPVFGQKSQELNWRPRAREHEKETDLPDWMKALFKLAELFAQGLRGLIYLLLVVAAGALIVVLYRYRHLAFGASRTASRPVETLFGLDLRPASLPDDIAAAALAELAAGRHAGALSLLYRGALVALIQQRQIEFRAGDTEDVCLRRINGRIDTAASAYFSQLLDAWKRTAYAHLPPDLSYARTLCLQWPQHFAQVGGAP